MDALAVGIDVGGTMIKGALLNSRAELLQKASVPTRSADEETFLGDIVALVGNLTSSQSPVAAVGIGIAGVIDSKRETLLESPNLPQLKHFPLKKKLEDMKEKDVPDKKSITKADFFKSLNEHL